VLQDAKVVILDEPTAALGVAQTAQVLALVRRLADSGTAVVMISHSLPFVMTSADELCVMYFGQIVEHGATVEVMSAPAHPYTKALLALAPDPELATRTVRRRLLVPGEIPSPDAPPTGCRFHPRCSFSQDICTTVAPPLAAVGGATAVPPHMAACHFARDVLAATPGS